MEKEDREGKKIKMGRFFRGKETYDYDYEEIEAAQDRSYKRALNESSLLAIAGAITANVASQPFYIGIGVIGLVMGGAGVIYSACKLTKFTNHNSKIAGRQST